jgi:hypothetical protein
MNAHADSEDQAIELPAIGLFARPVVSFESLPAPLRKRMFLRHVLFEWKTSE